MPLFTIAGKADCPLFVNAVQIANYLSEKLPDVIIEKKEFLGKDWNEFLLDINRKNKWYLKKSPVIWKEITSTSSNPHLIGGLSEFWEYIDDYYGVTAFLEKRTIRELCSQNLESFQQWSEREANEKLETFTIGIFGFNNQYAQMLLPELFTVPNLFNRNTIIKIYDPESLRNFEILDELKEIISEYQTDIFSFVNYTIILSSDLTTFMSRLDLLLITEDYSQRSTEERISWLKRCSVEMFELSNEINDLAKKNLRVVCCHDGPVCFSATCLARYCQIVSRNIVAVTAQEGLKALVSISKLTEWSISNLGAPPVWGFVGLDQFIDVQGVMAEQNIIIPYKRAIKNIAGSTLPQIKIVKEIRMLSCISNRRDIENDMIESCNLHRKLQVKSNMPLLRATTHLLGIWYSTEKSPDQIISLGILSTRAFGVPNNIVFSQPVILDDRKVWVPFEELPIVHQSCEEIKKCIKFTEHLITLIKECF